MTAGRQDSTHLPRQKVGRPSGSINNGTKQMLCCQHNCNCPRIFLVDEVAVYEKYIARCNREPPPRPTYLGFGGLIDNIAVDYVCRADKLRAIELEIKFRVFFEAHELYTAVANVWLVDKQQGCSYLWCFELDPRPVCTNSSLNLFSEIVDL